MTNDSTAPAEEVDGPRRDFLLISTATLGAAGLAAAAWPFIDSANPAQNVLALAKVEVDISAVKVGQAITVKWRGQPIFIRHRTAQNIAEARAVDVSTLRDPATDAQRVQRTPWLIQIGICTHLGCIPNGQKPGSNKGIFNGWHCPCHGSVYDTAGRIRQGPAPLNLILPKYVFKDDTTVVIG